MPTELTSAIILLLVCCLLLVLIDLLVAGSLALLFHLAFRRCFLWGLLSLTIPVMLLAYGMLIERNTCQVKQVEIPFPTLPADFDGYQIVQLSDIHCRSFNHRQRALQRFVDKANALQPDLICFTGDIVTLRSEELNDFSHILRQLHAPNGVVAIVGNHDYCTYGQEANGVQNVIKLEREMGWQVLLNSNIMLRRGKSSLAIVGVENISTSPHFPSKGDLARAMVGTQGTFRILLSHDPTHWDKEVVGSDIPLTLSGHTHAAQTRLLGWSPARYFYTQWQGLYEKMGQYLYINQGLGETIFPARIGAPPEITLITLRKSCN